MLDAALSAAERESLNHLEFLHRLLAGPAEARKSRILQAIGRVACVLGYNVRYATSAKLLQEFTAAMADGSYGRLLAAYARLDLLLIDEFGFDRLEREAQAQASTVYYRLLDARTGRRSTAVVTNVDFKAWADYLGDPPLATAFLDRLVDGAVILKLTGRSYRAHRARPAVEAEAAG
jgi:DNA replication protein DnaC